LQALVGDPDGTQQVRDEIRGPADQAEALGVALAQRLLADGASTILQRLGVLA